MTRDELLTRSLQSIEAASSPFASLPPLTFCECSQEATEQCRCGHFNCFDCSEQGCHRHTCDRLAGND